MCLLEAVMTLKSRNAVITGLRGIGFGQMPRAIDHGIPNPEVGFRGIEHFFVQPSRGR
jgi:hypothetical protein